MPRLLIYEECLAAGTAGPLGAAAAHYLPEGLAMALAVAEDFSKLPGWQVRVARAAEFASLTPAEVPWQWISTHNDLEANLARVFHEASAVLVIAPECEGLLQQRAQLVVDVGGTLLGPSPKLIALASDKSAVLEQLSAKGILTPRGKRGSLASHIEWQLNFPVILKPNDGAGAGSVWRIPNHSELQSFIMRHMFFAPIEFDEEEDEHRAFWRCEEFVPGQAASVALLCGPAGAVALRPATQQIDFAEDGRASYQGGAMNLSPPLEARAQRLGLAVAAALPSTNGYIGIDLILGHAVDGSEDTVIEVNPRLTSSYLGLRAATDDSLANALWRIACGNSVDITWLPNTVEFTKQGQVTIRDR
jgi:predicted ATP-grasp superfamily ATP-dependent carboligase